MKIWEFIELNRFVQSNIAKKWQAGDFDPTSFSWQHPKFQLGVE